MSGIDVLALLAKKRRGQELTVAEMEHFMKMVTNDVVGESQIGAMLMAIAINGLSVTETQTLTKSMVNSGYVFKWGDLITCDKHSTGGVGDKVSIPLVPVLAALGLKVPMISGRGLGLTGGTLDKLESIPGFRVNLTVEEMKSCMDKCGAFIASATKDICPGDRKLYPVRDVTATIDRDELIIASILSKKAAAGVKCMVLNVTIGGTTPFQTVSEAETFAKQMMEHAALHGMKLVCILSKMDKPVGQYVGNSLEIEESIHVLKGAGAEDLVELVQLIGARLLVMGGKADSMAIGVSMVQEVLKNGKALKTFVEIMINQGVDPVVADTMCYDVCRKVLPKSKETVSILAKESGRVTGINGTTIAKVVRDLGGGRKLATDSLDFAAGIVVLVQIGDRLSKGDPWLTVYQNEKKMDERHIHSLENALTVSEDDSPLSTSSVIKFID